MINYIEIFEEETILSKRSVKYYLRQNDKESCIQEATVIIGPHDLVNKRWPNIKYANKIYFSRLNILVDQISFPIIWTHPWKFLTSFSFIYYFFQIFFQSWYLENLLKKTESFLEKTISWLTDPRYGHQTFSRDSSEYLQHSVISLKRIAQF